MDVSSGYGIGYRHVQVALIVSMVVIGNIIFCAIPTVIVAITDPGTSPNPDIPSYPEWSDQSLILVSFYWGNVPALLMAGPLCRKYGAKWFMVASMMVASLVSLAAPSCIMAFGSIAFIVCFFIQGICQGIIMPMLSDFISKWVPLPEITTIGAWIFSGITLGAVIATELSGFLSSTWYGWPSVFYFTATIGTIWCIFMVMFGCTSPEEHNSITDKELEYIKMGKNLTKKKIPWSHILKSSAAWATWITQICLGWTLRLYVAEAPTYINRVLGLNVATGSRILAIIYLLTYLNTFLISGISQYLINKKYLTVCAARKLCNSIACWGSAFNLILLGTFNFSTNTTLFIIFLVEACSSAGISGFNINYNDLSPNYCSCLIGVGGVATTVVSFFPILLVQFMVTDQKNPTQWGHVFWLAAIITSVGNCIFIWKAEADIQEWDNLEDPVDRESYLNIDEDPLIVPEKLCEHP